MEKRNYLNGNEPWQQDLEENHEFLHDSITKEIFLESKDVSDIGKGIFKNLTLKEWEYFYELSCDIQILECTPAPDSGQPYGAYLRVESIETKEAKRTQRFTKITDSFFHIKLPFVILGDHDAYRIGVYMDGKCKMKIQNLQLIKGDYHGQYYGDEVFYGRHCDFI